MRRSDTPLRSPLPSARPTKSLTVDRFSALDVRRPIDSASLVGGFGIGHGIPQALSSARLIQNTYLTYSEPISMCSVGDALAIFYRAYGEPRLALRGGEHPFDISLEGYLSESLGARCVVAFNRYNDPLDPVSGEYERQLLIFPDKLRVRLGEDEASVERMESEENPLPTITRACVHSSRLFGIGDERVWVSAYNEPDNFELDTASSYGASSAWAGTLQSNTRAGGEAVALALCDGRVLCFKQNFCHSISNSKNPFRTADLFARGALSAEAVAELDGGVLFISDDGLYIFAGAYPERLSEPIGELDWQGGMLCVHGSVCYIYLPREEALFTLDTRRFEFGRLALPEGLEPISLAATDDGAFALGRDGRLWRLDGDGYGEFRFELAALTLGFDGPWRADEISVAAKLYPGALLRISMRGGDGEETRIAEFLGENESPRVYTCEMCSQHSPIGECASIIIEGDGRATILKLKVRGESVRGNK